MVFCAEPGDRVEVDEPIAQVKVNKLIAKEGDTVEPGTKVAVISKSVESATHVASSDDKPSDKAAPKIKGGSKPKEEPKPKVETKLVLEKPKGSSPPPSKASATELQLLPKDRERRVPMTRLIKHVATRLKDSQNTFAWLTTFNEVYM